MPRKHRSDWGSNEPAGRGKRRLRFMADMHDGRGYRRCSKTIRGTRKDGAAELARLWTVHARDAPSATLGRVYLEWWLPDAEDRLREGDLAQNTFDLYKSLWRNHIEPRWGSVEIDSIRPTDVQEWLLTLSKWNAINCRVLAGSIVEKGITMEVADRNQFARKYRIPRAAEERSKAIWNLSQVSEAMERLKGSELMVSVALCALGSCRVGESCAVRADEVQITMEHGMAVARVPIVRQLMRTNEISDKLKNKQSERTVCIPEPWSLWIGEKADEVIGRGLTWLNDDGAGYPVSRPRLKSQWADAFASRGALSGLPRVTMQNLRSTWETFMRWELGVDPDMVDSMMGHAGANVRTRHYDRPLPDMYAETCALAHQGAFKKG